MVVQDQIDSVFDKDVYGSDGDRIGGVKQVYTNDESGQPEWLTVSTGLFGTKETFIPLADADLSGDRVVVPFAKAEVKDAPNVDADGHLSPEEEQQLYTYYGRTDYASVGNDSVGGTTRGDAGGGTVGHDTSGPTTDDAMTVSEEQLQVGTERREAGRARLRKYVVTENVTQTVPVSHEEVRIEREPITDANVGDATAVRRSRRRSTRWCCTRSARWWRRKPFRSNGSVWIPRP
jgi:stress response protein YsnF